MKKSLLSSMAILLATVAFAHAEKMEKIVYPTADDPSFVIEVPASWEMEQAEEEGDYFHLTGPTGAVFSFRTIPGSEEALKEAIEASIEEVNARYNDPEIGEPEDWKPDGLEGFYATGQGTEKKSKDVVRIGMAWCPLKNGKIVEFWFVADIDDKAGIEAAEGIANSLQSP